MSVANFQACSDVKLWEPVQIRNRKEVNEISVMKKEKNTHVESK